MARDTTSIRRFPWSSRFLSCSSLIILRSVGRTAAMIRCRLVARKHAHWCRDEFYFNYVFSFLYKSKMEGIIESLSNVCLYRQILEEWWSKSKFFRIIALVTSSIFGFYSVRYTYIKTKRKYYNYPPGPISLVNVGVLKYANVWTYYLFLALIIHLSFKCKMFMSQWTSVYLEVDEAIRQRVVMQCPREIWKCDRLWFVTFRIKEIYHCLRCNEWWWTVLIEGAGLILINDPVSAKKLYDDPRASMYSLHSISLYFRALQLLLDIVSHLTFFIQWTTS